MRIVQYPRTVLHIVDAFMGVFLGYLLIHMVIEVVREEHVLLRPAVTTKGE